MAKFVVRSFATLHKDVLVEAETHDEAQEMVEAAFADGRLVFTMDDYVKDFNDYDVMFASEALEDEGISEEDCERI